MPISWSNSGDGSSSTMIAMFRISLRNRRGTDRSASATRRSNACRSTGLSIGWGFCLGLGPGALAGHHRPVVVAVVPHGALVAERFGAADAPAVEDQDVGGPRPLPGRHRGA